MNDLLFIDKNTILNFLKCSIKKLFVCIKAKKMLLLRYLFNKKIEKIYILKW